MEKDNKPKFIELNDFFCYGISNHTLHLHAVPKDIKGTINELGIDKTLLYIGEKLFDALQKAMEIASKNGNINQVFAVSPSLKVDKVRELFEMMGFKSEIATAPIFYEMFKQEEQLYQVSIPTNVLEKTLDAEKTMRECINMYSSNESMVSDIVHIQMEKKYNLVKNQIGDEDGTLFSKLIDNAIKSHSFRKELMSQKARNQKDKDDGEMDI